MRRTGSSASRVGTKVLALLVSSSLMAALLVLTTQLAAGAAGTVLFDNLFNDNTVDGTGTVTVPAPVTGTNVVCLTAKGNGATNPVASCGAGVDNQGSGKLRLTSTSTNQVGGVFGAGSFPTSNGLDVTFNSYQWGGNNADGIAFLLAAVDPSNPVAPGSIAGSGGALGYSTAPGLNGLSNAYLGVGLDVFGNFSNSTYSGTGCVSTPNFGQVAPGTVAVRGPGNLRVGYCGLNTTYDGTIASKLFMHATTRALAVVPVQVLINPTVASFTSATGVTVAPGTYKVVVTPIGQTVRTLTGTLPTVAAGLYPSSSWLNTNGMPKQLAFGFVGSTGSVTDNHEISDVRVLTFNPVPQLAVAATSYTATASHSGDPITYSVVASVLTGSDVSSPISVTETVPVGSLPVGAFGSGWACQSAVGQAITCTTTGSTFSNGTVLSPVTVVAIATSNSAITAGSVQAGSTSRVSSADANPASITTTTAGILPLAPTGITVTPSTGVAFGGDLVTIGGTNIVAATAIEIGTAAQQQAATPVVLLPCAGGATVGCFSVSGGNLVIASMPAHTSATVSVTVVTAGTAAAGTFVYVDRPATPAAPTATAGITSATVTWVAPATNGDPITAYIVTPYLGGTVQTPLSFDASTTTRILGGLTPGSSYTFTVAATNVNGTSAASAKSAVVIPYTLPGAPSITAAGAADSAATLTWTAPGTGGSAITGYVVVPYIGAAAQTAQTFSSTATTQTVTGLTPGTAYTFTVAAQNLAGTGPASVKSAAVTPNQSPTLSFSPPPAGEVGVAYSRTLAVTNGTSPFGWSVSAGALPGGLTLNASTGLLSGAPSTAGTFTFTVQVVDASDQSATQAVTLVIAAAPALTFAPAAGEVGVAYSQQPSLSGGTAPFVWAVVAGSLPLGLTLNASTGLVSGTPTAAGSASATIRVTDSFSQVASRTVAFVVVARPAFAAVEPPTGAVGVTYASTLGVSGGAPPLSWSITAGSLPAGLTLDTATGRVSGIPTTAGSSVFTASVVDANAQAATRSFTLVVGAGPLVIVTSSSVTSAAPGATIRYTVTVTNTGQTLWTGAALSDSLLGVLDDATYNADVTATSGAVSFASSTVSWAGDIGAGGTVTITFTVTVKNPDTGNGLASASVTSSTLGANCAASTNDARCSATVTVDGLSIVQTADAVTTTPGSAVHFTVTITNSGKTAFPSASVIVGVGGLLDDGTYNADGLTTAGNVSYTAPSLTWTGSLAPGAVATVTYSATVANPDEGDRLLTVTAVSAASGSACPPGNSGSCTATVTVLVPSLVIVTTAEVSTTTPGGVVSYSITMTNIGQTAYTGATVTVDLAGALDGAFYNADAAATAGGVVFSAGVVTWTGNVAIGAVVTVTASVTVRDPYTGGGELRTTTRSPAAGSTCPAVNPGPACRTTVGVRLPELTIGIAADVVTTTPGSIVHYSVSVTNTGQTTYTGVTVSIPLDGVLDDATYRADVSATAGAATFASPTLSWTGDLLIGATATITYSVIVRNPDTGNKSLVSTVVSSAPGSTCPTGGSAPVCTRAVAVLIPALTVTSSVGSPTSTPGAVVSYTLRLENTGETPYSGLAVTLDFLRAVDDATYNNDASVTTGGLVTNLDGTVDWVLDLVPGAGATGAVSFTVNTPDLGDRVIVITAVADAPGTPCPTELPNAACSVTVTVLRPGLTITKTAGASTVRPGDVVSYTVTVENTGETLYAAATFTDDLSRVVTDATYAGGATATSGAVSYSAPVLSWTGAMAIGATATISYFVTVRDPDPGDKLMVNAVVSTSAGSDCPSGSTDTRCTAVVAVLVPELTIDQTANVATTTPGASVGYTISVTNSGATPFTGAAVAVALAGVLDDATYRADAAAETGSVGVAGSTLTWTGDLAVGATATITYSVTVNTADIGNDLLNSAVTSTARGNNCTSGSADGRCATSVPVARLILAYGATDPTTTPGSTVSLNVTYNNTGQVPYVGISVALIATGAVDDAVPVGDQTASSGALVVGADGLTWTGDIAVGAVVTGSGSLIVLNPDPGDKHIIAVTASSAPGNNCPPASTDPRCRVQVDVLVPGLTITTTANTTATVPGGSVGYTITVHNTGQTAFIAATVTGTLAGVLDDATYNADASATAGAVTFASPVLSWTGDLAVGAAAVITFSVTAKTPATGDKTMVSPVSSTAVGSTCPPNADVAACRSTVVVLTAALTIVQTASLANATLGTAVDYTVVVTNTGQTTYLAPAFTISLAGVLDDAAYSAGSAAASAGSVGVAGGVLSWTGTTLDPGGSVTVTYRVIINNPATGDGTMPATVVSATNGSNCASGGGDTRCTADVAVTNAVTLTFTKTAGVAVTVAGEVVHYRVTIVNSSGLLVTGASFTDSLAGIVDDATYAADAATTGGVVLFAGGAITWTGTVAAGATVTITYSVTVHITATGDQVLQGTVTSASLSSHNCASGSTDPRCSNTVPIAGLVIQQQYTETSTTPGSLLHLAATFTNTGAYPYLGISVSSLSADTVDDAIPSGDQSASAGTLVLSATAITWTGNIPVGDSVTVSGTLRVKDPDPGNKSITGTLSSPALGSNCPTGGTDSRCTALVAVLLPGLTITTSASAPATLPGGSVGYTTTVHNTGQTPYVAATVSDTLAGILDDATYNVDAAATAGAVTFSSPVLSWTGDLAVGATAVITYSVTAKGPATGDKTMVNVVSSTAVGSTCPFAASNPNCLSIVAVLTPALAITSTANVGTTVPGATVSYTLTIADTGQTPYFGALVSVALAGVLDDATLSGGPSLTPAVGAVGVASGTLTWMGDLMPGASVAITYSVTVAQPVAGDYRLASTAVSTAPGSTCPTVGAAPSCTVSVPIAGLRIVSATDVATATPTGVVQHAVTFTNLGQVPYVDLAVVVDFSGSGDDAGYNGDAAATGGSVSVSAIDGRATWTGDLPVGASATMTGSLTVNNPDAGNKIMTTKASTTAEASNCASGSVDPRCATRVDVLIPVLAITVSADTTVAGPGSTVRYTITIANSGPTRYAAAIVRDDLGGLLGDATYNHDAIADDGAVDVVGSTLTWTGDLALSQTVVVSYSVTVKDPDLGGKLMVNGVVSDDLGSTCPTGESAPACVSYVTVLVPALDISLAADRSTTVPGGVVAYTLTIHNDGQTDYENAIVTVALTRALDDAGYNDDATATDGSVALGASNVIWTGDVDAGATVTVTYSVTVDDPDGGDHVLDTTVTSPSPGSSCGTAPRCGNSVTVLIPGLAASIVAGVTTAHPGDRVSFTITLTNTGQTVYDSVDLAAGLAAIVDDAGFDGTISSSIGLATYAAPNLAWAGILHEGDTATITFDVTVRDPDPGDKVMSTTVQVPVEGSNCGIASSDPSCAATVIVKVPALAITVLADSGSTTPGGTVAYTAIVTNAGETAYGGAVVNIALSGVLSDSVYNADATVEGGGTLGYAGSVLTWTGDVALAGTVTIRYSITVRDPDRGDKEMVTTISSSLPGSSCLPASGAAGCVALVRVLVPALVITQTAPATVVAGSTLSYTVTVVNTGQTAYAPAVLGDLLTGLLDDATFSLGNAAVSAGDLSYDGATLSWSGSLAVGASSTITYSVAANYPASGDRRLVNAVRSDAPGSTCVITGPGCDTVADVLVPALEVVKTVDASAVVAGGIVRYTISATNTGEAAYRGAVISDSLTDVLLDATFGGDAAASTGAVSVVGDVVSWTGDLATGASVVITYSVTVDVGASDVAVLVNAVTSASVGSTCPVGGTDPSCTTSTTIVARSITLSDLTGSFTLAGLPNSTVDAEGAVTMTVATNSPGGVTVTVQPSGDALVGSLPGNTATIPVSALGVRRTGTLTYEALSPNLAVMVHNHHGTPAPGGEAVSTDFQVQIPFVPPDSYSATLEFIASGT